MKTNGQSVQSVRDVQGISVFPVEVFPKFYQDLIQAYRDTLGFERPYSGLTILSIVSTCIGNSIKVKVKRGWIESPILYTALYGDSSKKKTPVLNTFLVPFYKKEESYQEDFDKDLSEWNQLENKPNKPKRKHILINDATPESIIDIHSNNQKSLLYLNDELISMVKRFNQYRNGPDQEFWLSQWSNTPIKITRKTSDTIYFKQPFISVLGGIQPAMLKELAKDSRGDNGFLYRILFAVPEDDQPDQWNENEVDEELIYKYNKIIKLLDEHFDSIEGTVEVEFSEEAKKIFISWYNDNAGLIHHSEDKQKSIYKKLEAYCIRFALILEVMFQSEPGGEVTAIGEDAVNGAIQLTEYFRQTSIYMNEQIKEDSFNTEIDQQIYKELSTEFSTHDIVSISNKFKVEENTVKTRLIPRLIREGMIKRERHGRYSKNTSSTVHSVHFVHKEPEISLKDHEAQADLLFGKEKFENLNEFQKEAIISTLGPK